jgi:hypothetical protein
VAACYAPAAQEGAPCGPGGECPSGQQCDPASLRCMRMIAPPQDALPDAEIVDAASTDFVDAFARPGNANIGNGWIEKNPAAFAIAAGEVIHFPTSPESYRDNLVYRPASEDLLDVEISVQVRFVQMPPRYPQIFVRARAGTADSYDGYLLYVEGGVDANQVILGRQVGAVFVETLSQFTLSESLNTTDRYRMVLRAQGTSPVMLAARVEKLVGAAWSSIGSTTFSDTAAERIAAPGTVGFAGDEVAAYVYDDFRRMAL